ncbi:MAG: redoxin domain-containing protein [Pseudomonadales bacterium]
MKKILIISLACLSIAALALYIFQAPAKEALYAKITADMFVAADDDNFDPGPALGSSFPAVRALYKDKELSQISQFAGDKGTVLVASRSMEWCPFCMKQMIQLQEHKAAFDKAGIGLVGITYDSPKLQQVFIDQFEISIPLLSDIDVTTFKTLGIVNQEYPPGDESYGIPYPGMIIIDPNGIVVGKLFLEGYATRVDSQAALEIAIHALADE